MKFAWQGTWVCLFLFNAGSSRAQPAEEASKKAVAALEEQWLQAQKTNNSDLLIPLLAAGLINTSADGKITNKAETISQARTTHWTSAEYSDVRIMLYGHAAIASGVFKGIGTDFSGKALNVDMRWTDTWVMLAGRWQCVASQDSPIKL
jgi:hypothetical protein